MTKPVRGQSQAQFTEYWHLIRQNKWWIFFLTIGLTVTSAVVIAALPNRFQASGALLVDPQLVPDDPGSGPGPARPSSLTDRLRTTTQEVLLSGPRLQGIINKYRLDPELRGTANSFRVRWLHMPLPSDEEVLEAMRKRIEITVKQSGTNSPVTVIISYESEDPAGAAQVANELTKQLIEWNVQGRQQQTSSATQFLKDQVEQTKKNIDEQEKVMRDFKIRHAGEMPADLQNDLQTMTQLREMRQANVDSLNRLSQEYVELTRPTAVGSGGKSNQPLTEREKMVEEKKQLQDKLKDLLKRYTPSFPEAVETQTRLNQVEAELQNMPPDSPAEDAGSPNATRIEANRRSTERLTAEQKRIDAQIADLEQKVAAVPLREQEFSELTRNYNITKQDYQTLFQKEAQAEMTESLEKKQGADRFVVLEAARPPERPYKPNRLLLLATALVASITLSVGMVVGKEQLSNTIRSEENLATCLPESVAVLASIPTIRTARDTIRRRMFAGFAVCALVAACFLVVVLFRKTLSL